MSLIDALSEIGVALTSFGGLFMLLGVMLFFDGALLALGNVSLESTALASPFTSSTGSVSGWIMSYHWTSKGVLFLCTKEQDTRQLVFPWRYPACFPQMAVLWGYFRSFRVS